MSFLNILIPVLIGGSLSIIWDLKTICFLSYLIQYIAAVPSIYHQTEHYYDFTGSLTYFILTLYSLSNSTFSIRSIILSSFVLVWCMRLGTFLFLRVKSRGCDTRFDRVRSVPLKFLLYWTVQGLWVFLTAGPVFILNNHDSSDIPLNFQDFIGMSFWVIGFSIEVISDHQKEQFRKKRMSDKKDIWIEEGLWSYSRHPNYVGEIILWIGIFISSSRVMSLYEFTSVISPIFVYCLLRYVSGVPLLEKKSDRKWGSQKQYQEYKKRTPLLFPWS